MTAVLKPLLPRDAIAAFNRRGQELHPSFAWQDVWQDEHQRRFTVAKSSGYDILKDIRTGIERAFNQGETERAFSRQLRPILEEKGWWGRGPALDTSTGVFGGDFQLGSMRRLKTIFDVNMRVSYAQGAWTSFERNKATRPWLRYVALLDGRTRPEHRARHNLCLPVDHPYWDIWAPPCGWNCRCTLQQLSDRDVERLKAEGEDLTFEPPEDETVEWLNSRTGVVETVPKGIDPGWAYNPGKVRNEATTAANKLIDAPPPLAAAAMAKIPVQQIDREYELWAETLLRGQRVSDPSRVVGVLSQPVLDALNTRGLHPKSAGIVILQGQMTHALRNAKKHKNRDPDESILLRVPHYLRTAVAVLRDKTKGELIFVLDFPSGEQFSRIVVRVDYVHTQISATRQRTTEIANMIVTIDRVDQTALTNEKSYEILWGRLK